MNIKKFLGFLVFVAGTLLWVFTYINFTASTYMAIFTIKSVPLMAIYFINVLMLVASIKMVKFGKVIVTSGSGHASSLDPRPPVLLLRAFDDDRIAIVNQFKFSFLWLMNPLRVMRWYFNGQVLTFEECLARSLAAVGPVIAIGRPGERFPPLGFARRWIDDSKWREEVERLIKESRLIVMILGRIESPSSGLGWELNKLIDLDVAEKMILVLPPNRHAAESHWVSYLACSRRRIQKRLDFDGTEFYILFDRAWIPSVFRISVERPDRKEWAWWRLWTESTERTGDELDLAYRDALRSVVERYSPPIHPSSVARFGRTKQALLGGVAYSSLVLVTLTSFGVGFHDGDAGLLSIVTSITFLLGIVIGTIFGKLKAT